MNKSDIVLVNADHPIDEHKRLDLIRIFDRQFVSYEAYRPFLDMYAQMKKEGLEPIVCSSYRSIEKQEDLFQGKCQLYLHQGYALEQAQELASQWVARPYCSEHHTGLAVDIVSKENERLDDSQEQTAVLEGIHHHTEYHCNCTHRTVNHDGTADEAYAAQACRLQS